MPCLPWHRHLASGLFCLDTAWAVNRAAWEGEAALCLGHIVVALHEAAAATGAAWPCPAPSLPLLTVSLQGSHKVPGVGAAAGVPADVLQGSAVLERYPL